MNRTYQKNGSPTMGHIKRCIRNMRIEKNQPSLFQLEQKGYIKYNPKNGTYSLTEEGEQALSGGQAR